MERNKSEKPLVMVYANQEYYLEWSEVCEVIGMPRTSLLRTINKLDLLSPDDIFYYKNRKLLKRDWAFGFWQKVSKATMRNKKL